MKIGEIYEKIIEVGIRNDPRGPKGVKEYLGRLRKSYDEMSKKKKMLFDPESLKNPYADTRILCGSPEMEIGRMMVGVDIGVGEVLLADRLNERGERIDLVMAHHPGGKAYATFYEVMRMQADIHHIHGVPINVAESLLEERMGEVAKKVMSANHRRPVDAAELLGIPLICAHTPADNCVTTYLAGLLKKLGPKTIGDIIDILVEVPEYERSIEEGVPPKVQVGSESRRPGEIFVDMTGGTEPSKKMLEKLSTAGVGTILCMHLSPEHLKEAEKGRINVIVTGHIASDNIGLNILLDELAKKGEMSIVPVSGFYRVGRRK